MADRIDNLPAPARCPECDNRIPYADVAMMMKAADERARARAEASGESGPPRLFFIPAEALIWLRLGDRGTSSEAIFEHLTGIPIGRGRKDTPSDPDDLRRCRRLLKLVPDFERRLSEMAAVSEQWAKLVKIWPRLCAIMDEELAAGNNCPRTWTAMWRLFYGEAPLDKYKDLPDELAEVSGG